MFAKMSGEIAKRDTGQHGNKITETSISLVPYSFAEQTRY